jgi:hypothetical protein
VTTELFQELYYLTNKEGNIVDVNKMTSQELFSQFNAIRVKHAPDGRPLRWKTWKKPFERAMREAPDAATLLDAWLLFWTAECYQWNRTVPANKAAYFLRQSNLPQWFDAVDAMRHAQKAIGAVENPKQDTSTLGLATTFWMRNRKDAGAARADGVQAFDAYLAKHCTHPDNVKSLLSVAVAQ